MKLFFDLNVFAIRLLGIFFTVITCTLVNNSTYFYDIRVLGCYFIGAAIGIKKPVFYISIVNISPLGLLFAQLRFIFDYMYMKPLIIYFASKVRNLWIYSLVTLTFKKNIHVVGQYKAWRHQDHKNDSIYHRGSFLIVDSQSLAQGARA